MPNIVMGTAAGAVLGGALLVSGGLGLANAVPANDINDHLVNLAVGDANLLRDVNTDVAAQVAVKLCGTGTSGDAGDLPTVAKLVGAGQLPATTCNSPQGVVTISQNS